MKRAPVGAIVKFRGRIASVIASADTRTLILRYLDEKPCVTCGREPDVHLVESSPLFQNGVEAVETVVEQ